MAIRIEQPGAAKAAAAAGTIIGKGQRAEEDRARAEREQARANAEAAQKQARQDEMKFALQKRQEDWQRSLAKERRQEDYQVAAEDRAVERGFAAADYTSQKTLERIEFSKDLEFQYETQERQRKVGEFDNQIKTLNDHADKGWVDRDFAWQDKMERAIAGRDAAKTGTAYREPLDPRAQELAENRETRAQESATRAEEVHEERIPRVPTTPEDQELAARRKRVTDTMGSAYREVPLGEAEAEMQGLGLMSQQTSREVTAPLSPEELKASAVGRSATERKAIYDRGVSLGYWN